MEATIVGLLPLQLGRLLVWGEALPIHVMVYGRFERGRPRSGRSRVRFVLFWYGYCLHALENRRAWPTNAGRSAEDSRGSGLPRLAPIPGLDGPPLGEPRDGRIAHISMVAPHLLSQVVAHCLLTCLMREQVAITPKRAMHLANAGQLSTGRPPYRSRICRPWRTHSNLKVELITLGDSQWHIKLGLRFRECVRDQQLATCSSRRR